MQWYSESKLEQMTMSFFKNGVAVSLAAKESLKRVKNIIFGVDKEKKIIVMKAFENEPNVKCYKSGFEFTSRANRIACVAFVRFAEKELNKILCDRRFPATFENGMLIADVSGDGVPALRKREKKV